MDSTLPDLDAMQKQLDRQRVERMLSTDEPLGSIYRAMHQHITALGITDDNTAANLMGNAGGSITMPYQMYQADEISAGTLAEKLKKFVRPAGMRTPGLTPEAVAYYAKEWPASTPDTLPYLPANGVRLSLQDIEHRLCDELRDIAARTALESLGAGTGSPGSTSRAARR